MNQFQHMNKRSIYFLLAVSLCFSVSVYTGLKMSELRFWGDLPLPFALASWFGILLLMAWKWPLPEESKYALVLSSLGGLFLGKAFVYFSPLLFLGFAALLLSKSYIGRDSRSYYKWQWLLAFNCFMIWNITATYWVANAALMPGLVAFFLNSLFMTVPWLLSLKLEQYKKVLFIPSLICFWLSFEMLHLHWEISWPWLNLGNGFAFYPKWIQWYEYTGAFGGTLWILVVNSLIYFAIISKNRRMIYGLCVLVLFGLPVYLSMEIYKKVKLEGNPVEVGIVQPNYEPHYEKFQVDPNLQMIKFEKLSRAALSPNTRYLIWPETSFEYIDLNDFQTDWRALRMRQMASFYPNLCLVSGLGTIRSFKAGEKLTEAARPNLRGNYPRFYEIQNSAVQFCSDNQEVPVYLKSKLVPGVETFPYRKILPFLKPVIDDLGGSIYGLGKQSNRTIFQQNQLKIAPVICYESIYGNYVGDYIRKGAQAIFIMTNDGWWDNTPGYKQHLMIGALRSIEYRRPIARSANTGISCFINARGDIIDPSTYGTDASLRRTIHFSDQSSFYLQYGDYIAKFALFISFGLLLYLIILVSKARFSKNQ